jgi:hypothetical protein
MMAAQSQAELQAMVLKAKRLEQGEVKSAERLRAAELAVQDMQVKRESKLTRLQAEMQDVHRELQNAREEAESMRDSQDTVRSCRQSALS